MNVYLTDEKGGRVPVVFTDVMLVPKLETSLISIGLLVNRGIVMFGRKLVKFRLKGHADIILGTRRNNSNMLELRCGSMA